MLYNPTWKTFCTVLLYYPTVLHNSTTLFNLLYYTTILLYYPTLLHYYIHSSSYNTKPDSGHPLTRPWKLGWNLAQTAEEGEKLNTSQPDTGHCLLLWELDTLPCTPYTGHFTPNTIHCTFYIAHIPLYTLHFTLYTLYCTLHRVHILLYRVHLHYVTIPCWVV